MVFCTALIRFNAAAFVTFFLIRVQRLNEGGVSLRSNFFLANNSMCLVFVLKVFLDRSQFHNLHVNTTTAIV